MQVAEQVMRMPEPQLERKRAGKGTCSDSQREESGREHRPLQLKSIGRSGPGQTEAPPTVHQVLRSPGQPLETVTRAFMEPRFGHDLSNIRMHADADAANSTNSVDALAYTAGNHIAFAAGQYNPATAAGNRLIAHELTHVMQQGRAGSPTLQRQPAPQAPAVSKSNADVLLWELDDVLLQTSRLITDTSDRRHAAFTKLFTSLSAHALLQRNSAALQR